MNQKKNREYQENPYHISYDNYSDTNAATECTGLIYSAAENGEEWERYHEIFDFNVKPDPKYPENIEHF